MGTRDVFVPMGSSGAALIRDAEGDPDLSETAEYAEALRDTLLAELGCEVTVGVGSPGSCPGVSYGHAEQALRLGSRYDPERGVYVWQRMIVERIADEIPADRRPAYRQILFNGETARALDEELLTTARTFLRCGLNLSDAARQLYIHRSTLVYRLDKLQRACGLDLRRFEDAVTFRLLSVMNVPDPGERARETA
jgi:carbohydrate diacid regulator